jgi:hypothetical protein
MREREKLLKPSPTGREEEHCDPPEEEGTGLL